MRQRTSNWTSQYTKSDREGEMYSDLSFGQRRVREYFHVLLIPVQDTAFAVRLYGHGDGDLGVQCGIDVERGLLARPDAA